MVVYENLILLKKIADYFKHAHNFELADKITAEFTKASADCPNFEEPEYVKDDLETIFFRHIKLKKRQSQVRLEKSTRTNRTIEDHEKSRRKKNKNVDIEETRDINAQQSTSNVQDTIIVNGESNTEHLQESAVLKELNTNIVGKSRHIDGFTNPFASTPIHRSNENINPFIGKSPISFIKPELTESIIEDEIEFVALDDDDVIITGSDNSIHQSIYGASTIALDDGHILSERMSQYEHNFIRPSQSISSSRAQSVSNETIKIEPEVSCTEEHELSVARNNEFDENLEQGTEIKLTQEYNNTMEANVSDDQFDNISVRTTLNNDENNYESTQILFETDNASHNETPNDQERTIDVDVIMTEDSDKMTKVIEPAPAFQLSVTIEKSEKEKGNNVTAIAAEYNDKVTNIIEPVPIVQEASHIIAIATEYNVEVTNIIEPVPIIQEAPHTKPQGCEIAIQCDEDEILGLINKRRRLSDELEAYRNDAKRTKLSNLEVVDIDDDNHFMDDLAATNNSPIITHEISLLSDNASDHSIREEVPLHANRSRHSSLSSLEMPYEEQMASTKVKTKKQSSQPFKSLVPFKNDKRIDMSRKVLMSDGWLLWPTSLLSGCLKNYTVADFESILAQYNDDNNGKLESRKDLFDCCLDHMCNERLILRIYNPMKKKSNVYMKLATLTNDSVELYEIDRTEYENVLWNKNAGPKGGRKMCAEAAPENVRELLGVELSFVEGLLRAGIDDCDVDSE